MRPHIGQRLRALIAGASLFTSASARADEPLRLDFSWEAPDGCPERAQVIAEIEKLVGRTVTGEKGGGAANEDGARLSVRAVVTRAAGGLSVDITSPSNGAVRDRRVEAPSCKEVASATALIVALALDPGLSSKETAGGATAGDAPGDATRGDGAPGTPANEPGGEAPGTHDDAPKSGDSEIRGAGPEDADSTAPSPLRVEGHAMFVLDAVSLPSAAPGVAAGLGLWVGAFRFDLTGTLFAEQRKTLAAGGGADIGFATAEIAAWAAPVRGPFEVLTGLGAEGGAIWGRGFGVQGARPGVAPWAALRPEAVIGYSPWDRVGLSLGASLVIPLVRQRFLLGKEELFVPGAASVRLLAGIFLRLP